jgi:hypothetical protein
MRVLKTIRVIRRSGAAVFALGEALAQTRAGGRWSMSFTVMMLNLRPGRCSQILVAVLALALLSPAAPAQAFELPGAPKLYRETNASAVAAFVRSHRGEVFVYGSLALLDNLEGLLLEGLQSRATRVRLVVDAGQAARLTRLASAGAEVRVQRGTPVSRNGYVSGVALFERRYALFRTNSEWQLLESPEVIGQIQVRLDALWAYSSPLKGR